MGVLSAVRDDSTFGKLWGQLGKVVHPNRMAVINQVDEVDGQATMSGGGARRPEQLFKVALNFGIHVTRELQLLEQTFDLEWPVEVAQIVRDFEASLSDFHAEVLRRWPGSEGATGA